MFEKSKWISYSHEEKTDGSFIFRKKFEFEKNVKNAVLNIIMLGYGIVKINGRNVTNGVLTTPFTAFDKRVLYSIYDVTDIIESKFALSIHLGNGLYNDNCPHWNYSTSSWRHHPKAIVELNIEFEDETTITCVSDSSWRTEKGPVVFNHAREGETYDAREEIKGWELYDFDDSSFKNAVICKAPGGILIPSKIPEPRVIRTLTPISCDNGIYDFGENISGRVRIFASITCGDKLTVEYAEVIKDGYPDRHINMYISESKTGHENKDIFISDGIKKEYASSFSYHGFRYVKITGNADNLKVIAEVIHSDIKTIGSFESSDELLNKIHKASVNSTLTNYMSIPTDCPHREQNGWTGDSCISAQQALMNFDMLKLYDKWIDDIIATQRPSGQISCIVPNPSWGYNWGSGPAWDAALMLIPYYVYQNTGDKSVIKKANDAQKKYLGFLNTMQEDNIIDFGLGDWDPPKTCNPCPVSVTDTAYYYAFFKIMAKYAEILEESPDKYLSRADEIKKSFRDKFLSDETLYNKQTFLACIIYQGLCTKEEEIKFSEMLNRLVIENDYHFDCGILGMKYIFTVLSEHGYTETLYRAVINPDMPSYAYWINQGNSTLCETWEMDQSLNHHMYSEVDYWFYRYIAGIRIDYPEIIIEPCFVVESAKAKHKDIEVSWNSETITVNVPKEATMIINGNKISLNKGTTTISKENLCVSN